MASSDKAEKIHGELQTAVAELTSSEDWLAAMTVAARFHRYSFGNCLLIASQRPEATKVAGYKTWQSVGRQVRRGERGISILAPSTRTMEREAANGDPEKVRVLVGFHVVSVFDVAQTDGPDLPQIPRPQTDLGSVAAGLLERLQAYGESLGYSVSYRYPTGAERALGVMGETNHEERSINVVPGDPARVVKTLVHEIAHVLLHPDVDEYARNRGVCEVEAESVAFVVCKALDVQTDAYSVPYVSAWSGGKPETVTRTGERVVECARRILDGLENDVAEAA